jgi:malonyl-CoA/methylmalonyl-CoA synthetase
MSASPPAWAVHPADPPDEGELLALAGGRLAPFKRPRLVRYVESLPRNALGKVLKHELRA